jgi:hypothetical protein
MFRLKWCFTEGKLRPLKCNSSRSKPQIRNHRSVTGIQPLGCEGVVLRVKKTDLSSLDAEPASSPALVRLLNDYQAATEQYGVIVGYLKSAIEVLPKAECQLLLEFAEIAKNHCERLHRTIGDRLGTHRKSA